MFLAFVNDEVNKFDTDATCKSPFFTIVKPSMKIFVSNDMFYTSM